MDAVLLYDVQRYEQSADYITHYIAVRGRALGNFEYMFVAEPNDGWQKGNNRFKVYLLAVDQLETLATAVYQAGSDVTKHFMTILYDAIRLRKECAEWYRFYDLGTFEEDVSHKNYTDALIRIYNMLKPLCPKAESIPPTSASTFDASRNLYAPLSVEDLSDIPDIPTTVPYKAGKKVQKSSYRRARTDREIKLHIFLFLKSATSITVHVREQIKRYVAGETPFDVCTTAWNVTIHLLRDLNEKFLEDVRKAEEGNLRPREFVEHSDILDYLHTAKEKAKATSKLPEDLCERTSHILQQCFTEPALDRVNPRSLGEPLEFSGDDDLALTYDEKVFLYSTTCLWALTKSYEITEADDSDVEFRPEAEYGTGLNKLVTNGYDLHARTW